uniref:Centrosome-associated protein ALMS1 isoform X2 n=1 Tax=Pogona vitticeps TaxID=103695 RepID=A0ABM5GKR0_9SAUR
MEEGEQEREGWTAHAPKPPRPFPPPPLSHSHSESLTTQGGNGPVRRMRNPPRPLCGYLRRRAAREEGLRDSPPQYCRTTMEEAPKESRQSFPIETTPPYHEVKEELLSQSSSGTQISNASGVSLGELIRRRSVINQGVEAWYRPCTEVDDSNLTGAKGGRLSQTEACDMTEFPMMEEGLVTPTGNSRRQQAPNMTHTPMLEIQDSCLSPNLPLMTTYSTQGQTFFSETVFPQTEVDFAPLRGILDASENTPRHLHMSEAVRLAATEVSSDSSGDCNFLSQHPLAFSTMAPSNASLSSCLSQHPLSFSGHIAVEQRQHGEEQRAKDGNSGVLGFQMLPGQNHLPAACPPKGSWGTVPGQDFFLLDSKVPTPLLLEMLEKEMGLAKDGGFSSSESSSCKSVSGKAPEGNETSPPMESIVLVEREPETFVEPHQQENTIPDPASFRLLSDTEGNPFRNSKDMEQLSVNTLQAWMSSRGYRMDLGDSCSIAGTSGKAVSSRQQVSDAQFEEQKRNLVKALVDCRLDAVVPLQPATVTPEAGNTCSKQVNTLVEEAKAGVTKKELTLSDYSIEREHKDTGVSPSFHEGSFFGHLAHPIHHSTPGFFAARSVKEEAPGVAVPAKSILQSPLSCVHEEIFKTSLASTCVPSVEEPRVPSGDDTCVPSAEEPLVLQSSQDADTGGSGSPGVVHPLKGRIQSLPCLNFMEKVGAWSMSQSAERMSDALALHASSGMSSRQKAYSAVADSLNSIRLRQKSHTDLKTGLVASFCQPVSMTSQHSYHKEPSQTLPLTRSHSENSVITVSKEVLKTEVGNRTNPDYDHQPAPGKDCVLGASGIKQDNANTGDSLIQHHTAVLVSAVSSDEETMESAGRGRGSNPDNFITSDRVAELLREEANSLSSSQEMSDGSQKNSRELPGLIKMDCFRDVSPDSLNQVTGSGTGSCTDLRLPSRQSSRRSSPLSGRLHSSLEDVPQTPDDGHINIEERIPVYLRNLGIDQSPSSILTPFMPRGPVREIELSPTELRTLKASTDLFTQRSQLSEGDSHSLVDAMQSSSNSSTVPGGSDPVPSIPLPAEPSPHTSRVSEFSPIRRQLQLPAPVPHPAEGTSETLAAPASREHSQVLTAVPPDLRSDEKSTKWGQTQMDPVHSDEVGSSQEKRSFSSPPEEKDGKDPSGKASSLSTITEREKDDSFIGTKTLKEIGKLLGEAESRTPAKNFKSTSCISSSMDLDSSSKQREKLGGCQDSHFLKGNTPGIQRIRSWDESLAKQDFQGDKGLSKTLSLSGNLKWGELLPVAAGEWHEVVDPVRRSEPEGCNSATVNKNLPVLVSSGADNSLCTSEDLKKFQATSSIKSLNNVSHPVGSVQHVLEKTKEAGKKEMGSSHESGKSSSVDSLGIKVRTLLQSERPMTQSVLWVGEQEHCGPMSGQKPSSSGGSSAFSRGDVGVQQSDHSSSLDSLAVRVKTLLEDERPVMHATQILQRAEEEEKRAHAWVKMKLATRPLGSVPDLNEEDRQMIEEIKRQQRLSARKAEVLKNQLWEDGSQRISSHSPIPEPNAGLSNLLGQNDLQKAIYTQNSQVVAFPELLEVQARPVGGAGSTFPIDPEMMSLTGVESRAYKQLQTASDNVLSSRQHFQPPVYNITDMHLVGQTSAPREMVGEERNVLARAKLTVTSSSTEPAKQITSITFASRKRSYSPSASCAPCPGLTEATPCNLVTSKAQSVTSEQPKSSRQHPEAFKSHPSGNPAAKHMPDMNVGFSSDKYYRQNDHKEELHAEDGITSQGKPQTSCVEQKVHFIMEAHEGIQSSSQALSDLRRHKKPLCVASDNQSEEERMRTDLFFSANSSQQKTDQACLQNRSLNGTGSFAHEPFFLKGKESTTTENKLTFDLNPCNTGDMGIGGVSPLPPASLDCFSAVVPVSPSSPTKKALSAVHITLSPKRLDLDCSSPLDAGPDMKRASGCKMSSKPATLKDRPREAPSRLKPPKTQDSSHFPRPLSSPDSHLRHSPVSCITKRVSHGVEEDRQSFPGTEQGNARVLSSGGLEEKAETTVASQTQRMSSDAITQITTESPEKTTYSAEIFVSTDSKVSSALNLLPPKRDQFPSTAMPAVNQVSLLEGQTGMPVLLPYKPPGSSEMYYVPCRKETLRLFRVKSETTVESSHSGSNDAVPPEFPPQTLGSWNENPPSSVAIRHREGIYSKRPAPRNAWAEEKMSAQHESSKSRNGLEPVKTTNSIFRPAQFYLHHPVSLRHETDHLHGKDALRQNIQQGHLAVAAKDFLHNKGILERSQAPVSPYQARRDDHFSPLTPELDYSFVEEFTFNRTSGRESPKQERSLPDVRKPGHEVAKERPVPSSPKTSLEEKQRADHPLKQGIPLTGSLDELWTKYLERQKDHPQRNPSSNRKELSLVERLDRLARLLQNPVRHSLPAKEEQPKGKEPKQISFQGKMASISKLATCSKIEESQDATTGVGLPKPRHQNAAAAVDHMDGSSEQLQNSEALSDTSSEMRPAKDSSVLTDITSESEATRLETESVSRTEASGSVSTIDTARLIRAFGRDRVKVSTKLSQLYSVINLQKTCSEKHGKRSRRARGTDYQKMAHSEQKRQDSQTTDSVISSDSVSTASVSRGPSSALSHKRNPRMLNKAIQAGDFEIVNSGTKRHTRDVGLTFPTPASSQARLQGGRKSGTEDEVYGWLDGPVSEGKQTRQPNGFLAEKRPRRNKLQGLQGVSWFVPAEDLKAEPRGGNGPSPPPEPGSSWFEPLLSTKPWREPLREKNWQEDHCEGLQLRLATPRREGENKPPRPFVKMTLQEALALHRPDFISSSGERVKRLKLIIEERKLQRLLQGEREELFNPLEGRRKDRKGSDLSPSRGYRTIRRKRAISKSEMVQRSKRIYEQLPEVRKRREEEKRKSDYSTNRLKAQLYKTKITNHILGRKVPWE